MKRIWDIDELKEHCSLRFEENRRLKTKPARNHLPFAVQLKFYQNTGRFPSTINEIPETPLHYLADQLEEEGPASLSAGQKRDLIADPETLQRLHALFWSRPPANAGMLP